MDEKPKKLIIRKGDLYTSDVEADLQRQLSFGMGTADALVPQKPPGLLHKSWFTLMLAGALGAFLAWAIIEPFFEDLMWIKGNVRSVDPNVSIMFEQDIGAVGEMNVSGNTVVVLEQTWIAERAKPDDRLPFSHVHEGVVVEVGGEVIGGVQDAMIATHLFLHPNDAAEYDRENLASLGRGQTVWNIVVFPFVAVLVGLVIGAADGILSRAYRRAVVSALVCVGVGGIAALVLMLPAALIFGVALTLASRGGGGIGEFSTGSLLFIMAGRGLAWALLGAAAGIGQGIAMRSKKLFVNGLVGGLVGGLLGGLLFDPIDFFLVGREGPRFGAELSRMTGFVVIGLSTGLMIGIVELLAREAWVRMLTGPITGKEFILYRNPTAIGSSPKSDIYLFKDPQVEVVHALIHQAGEGYEIEDKKTPSGTFVNGRRVNRQRLNHEDQVRIGNTVMSFQLKED
ncbi:MAG: FHA domain-containing protein [Planctomycetota bacterium]|jgi:hypothetical protein